MSLRIEKIDVSLASNIGFDTRLSAKSLKYVKKSNGPKNRHFVQREF